jgi:hypothetical protein
VIVRAIVLALWSLACSASPAVVTTSRAPADAQESRPLLTRAGVVTLRLDRGDVIVRVRSISGLEKTARILVHSSDMWEAKLADAGDSIVILFQEVDGTFVLRRLRIDSATLQTTVSEIWRGRLDGAPYRLIILSESRYLIYGHGTLFRIESGGDACEVSVVRNASIDATSMAVRGSRGFIRGYPHAVLLDLGRNSCVDAGTLAQVGSREAPVMVVGSAGREMVAVEWRRNVRRGRLAFYDWSGNAVRAAMELPDGDWPYIVPIGEDAVVYAANQSEGFFVHGTTVTRFKKPIGSHIAESADARVFAVSETIVQRIDLREPK